MRKVERITFGEKLLEIFLTKTEALTGKPASPQYKEDFIGWKSDETGALYVGFASYSQSYNDWEEISDEDLYLDKIAIAAKYSALRLENERQRAEFAKALATEQEKKSEQADRELYEKLKKKFG